MSRRLSTAGLVRLIPVTDEHRASMIRAYPYYADAVIPDGAYPGVDQPVPTISVLNWIVGDASLDDAVVTLLLDMLANERSQLERVHAIASQIDLDVLGQPTPIPLHPAATAWFRARP